MRQKAIEKILPRLSEEDKTWKAEYVLDAFLWEGDLIADVYHNTEERLKPVARAAMNEKDFATYEYAKKLWTKKYITNVLQEVRQRYTKIENTEGTQELVESFTEHNWTDCLGCIEQKEEEIGSDKRRRSIDSHLQKIQEKMAKVPAPPKDFPKYIQDKTFRDMHYLFFTGKEGWCCRCGKAVSFQTVPKQSAAGSCPACRKSVKFRKRNPEKVYEFEKRREVLYIQPKNNGWILRYFAAYLSSGYGKKEKLELEEYVRTYHGRRLEDYYEKYIKYKYWENDKTTFWSDKAYQGVTKAYGQNTYLYGGNLAEVREHMQQEEREKAKYFPLEKIAEEAVQVPAIQLIQRMNYDNRLEVLYKMGLYKLAKNLLQGRLPVTDINLDGKTVKQIWGISRPKLNMLIKKNGNAKMLHTLQDIERLGAWINEVKAKEIVEAGVDVKILIGCAEKNKVLKLLHYLEKAEGYQGIKETISHYRDYLYAAAALEYDLGRDTVRYPKNLLEAHNKAVRENSERQQEEYIAEKQKKYPEIAQRYEDLYQEYAFEDKNFLIRPARDAGEIIREGRILHHCVGGDSYMRNHNAGESYIFFLRRKGTPQESYYTVEYNGRKIVQYYGAYDKKPDKEIIDKFLSKWKTFLAGKTKAETIAG